MKKYEATVILKPHFEEEAAKAEFEKINALITRFGGTVEKVDDWGKRKLAYPIDKIAEGVYTFITFSAEAGVPAEIESRLRIMENVMRFLLIRKDV